MLSSAPGPTLGITFFTLCTDAYAQNSLELPTEGGYLCSDLISIYDSACGITLVRHKELDELREITLDKV